MKTQSPRAKPPKVQNKLSYTFRLDPGLVERAQNTAAALSRPPFVVSLTSIVERGLQLALEELEKQHNGGKPFSPG